MVSSFELTRDEHESLEKQGTRYFGKKLIEKMEREEKVYHAGIAAANTTGFQIIELSFENVTTGSNLNLHFSIDCCCSN